MRSFFVDWLVSIVRTVQCTSMYGVRSLNPRSNNFTRARFCHCYIVVVGEVSDVEKVEHHAMVDTISSRTKSV